MQFDCLPTTKWAVVAFLVVGFLAHVRGVALLLREVRSWWDKQRNGYDPKDYR